MISQHYLCYNIRFNVGTVLKLETVNMVMRETLHLVQQSVLCYNITSYLSQFDHISII